MKQALALLPATILGLCADGLMDMLELALLPVTLAVAPEQKKSRPRRYQHQGRSKRM